MGGLKCQKIFADVTALTWFNWGGLQGENLKLTSVSLHPSFSAQLTSFYWGRGESELTTVQICIMCSPQSNLQFHICVIIHTYICFNASQHYCFVGLNDYLLCNLATLGLISIAFHQSLHWWNSPWRVVDQRWSLHIALRGFSIRRAQRRALWSPKIIVADVILTQQEVRVRNGPTRSRFPIPRWSVQFSLSHLGRGDNLMLPWQRLVYHRERGQVYKCDSK